MAGIAHLPGDWPATTECGQISAQFLRVTGVPGRCQGFLNRRLLSTGNGSFSMNAWSDSA